MSFLPCPLFRTRSLLQQVFGCAIGKLLLAESAPGQVKKILTGDLNAPVVTQPYFPGKEDHLLRAMIADISAAPPTLGVGSASAGPSRSLRSSWIRRMRAADEVHPQLRAATSSS